MARDYIKIDTTLTTAKFSSELRRFVDDLRAVIQQVDRLKAICTHNNDGTTYTDVETLFGLAAGKGATMVSLISGIKTALNNASDAVTLTDTVG